MAVRSRWSAHSWTHELVPCRRLVGIAGSFMPALEPPDTAPELSDCLESGTDDHKTGKNDDGGIRGR